MSMSKVAVFGAVCAASLMVVGAANAQQTNSTQINVTHITGALNDQVSNVDGAVSNTAAAIGNSATITVK